MEYFVNIRQDFMTGMDQVWIGRKNGDKFYRAKIEFIEIDRTIAHEPTISAPEYEGFLSTLTTALKSANLLQSASIEALKAQEKHLNDMRRLVFKDKL